MTPSQAVIRQLICRGFMNQKRRLCVDNTVICILLYNTWTEERSYLTQHTGELKNIIIHQLQPC